jgi:hypothetical protein
MDQELDEYQELDLNLDQYQDLDPEYLSTNTCNYCIYSSFLFATNVLTGVYFGQYLYAFLFLLLTLSSIIHHSSKMQLTRNLDQIALYTVISYGGYKFYKHYLINSFDLDLKTITKYAIIIITFLLCIFLYFFGYFTSNYVFHPEYITSQLYHVLMHFCATIGHHIIIAL